MPATLPSLWPADFGELTLLPPVAILRQQGEALGQLTQNIVVGRVETVGITGRIDAVGPADGFRQVFYLYCSPLSYSTQLLWADHGIDLYPVWITVTGEDGPQIVASSADDHKEKLKEVFASERTKKSLAASWHKANSDAGTYPYA